MDHLRLFIAVTIQLLQAPDIAFGRHKPHDDVHAHVSPLPFDCDHWGYRGKCGEDKWGIVSPICGTGQKQSPINIDIRKAEYDDNLDEIEFFSGNTDKSPHIVNNAHTAVVHFDNEYYVKGGDLPGKYKVAQLHFHWGSDDFKGSEHTIDRITYPLEVHIVTYNRDKYENFKASVASDDEEAVAVFASFAQVSDAHQGTKIFDEVTKALAQIKYEGLNKTVVIKAFPPWNFVPASRRYYIRYLGSFTTPPCSQIVVWTLFKNTIPISHEQLRAFRQLSTRPQGEAFEAMANNFRSTQPLNNRTVTRNFRVRQVGISSYQIIEAAGRPGIQTIMIVMGGIAAFLMTQLMI